MAVYILNHQDLLVKALEEGNLNTFKEALIQQADPNIIIKIKNISVFEVALQSYGCAEFVAECIKSGCEYDYQNPHLHKHPINFATDSCNPEILSQLLQFKNIPIDSKYANLTPLNSFAKNITSNNFNDVFKCIQMLIDYGANPNIPDHEDTTPIIHIIKNIELDNEKKMKLIKYLIDLESPKIDVDSYTQEKVNARMLLKKIFPEIELPLSDTIKINCHTLSILLGNKQEKEFIKHFGTYQSHLDEMDIPDEVKQKIIIYLLKIAVQRNLNNVVKVILKTGVDVNVSENGYTAIEFACNHGKREALQILLENNKINLSLRSGEKLLINLTKNLDETCEDIDYKGCFETFLNSSKINLNEVDELKSSALHYAVKNKNEEAIIKFLDKGAYMGTKNSQNIIPISGIDPEILEECLDKCITTNGLKHSDDNIEININYINFLPSNLSQSEEMLPIIHIAESDDLRHLLNHPVITSFLYLKWRKHSSFFYINFIFNFLFCISLMSYIFLDVNNAADKLTLDLFKILSILGLIYIIVREIIQFIQSPKKFAMSLVNYFKIGLIVLTILTLFNSNYIKESQRSYALLTILLASIEFYLLIGSLPILTICTHFLMLKAVSISFIKSFSQYLIFLITFGLCFHIVFRKAKNSSNNSDNEDEYFNSILTAEFGSEFINSNSSINYGIFIIFVSFMGIVILNLLNDLAVSDTQKIRAQAELNGNICLTYLLASHEKSIRDRKERGVFIKNVWPLNHICKKLTTSFRNYIHGEQITIRPNAGNKIFISRCLSKYSNSLKCNIHSTVIRVNNDDNEKEILRFPIPSYSRCCCGSYFNLKYSAMEIKTGQNALAIIEKKRQIQKQNRINLEQETRLKNIDKKIEELLTLIKKSGKNVCNVEDS